MDRDSNQHFEVDEQDGQCSILANHGSSDSGRETWTHVQNLKHYFTLPTNLKSKNPTDFPGASSKFVSPWLDSKPGETHAIFCSL